MPKDWHFFVGYADLISFTVYYGTVVFAGTGIKNSFVTQMILVIPIPSTNFFN